MFGILILSMKITRGFPFSRITEVEVELKTWRNSAGLTAS